MARRRSSDHAAVEAAAAYITAQIDGADWAELLARFRFCAGCPARHGPIWDSDDVINLCAACPLRPLMLAVADLDRRQNRNEGAG